MIIQRFGIYRSEVRPIAVTQLCSEAFVSEHPFTYYVTYSRKILSIKEVKIKTRHNARVYLY